MTRIVNDGNKAAGDYAVRGAVAVDIAPRSRGTAWIYDGNVDEETGRTAIAFVIVTFAAGLLSLAGAALAAYLAVLTRRARALGARWVPVPLTGRQVDAPSALVLAVFAAAFAVVGALLILSAVVG